MKAFERWRDTVAIRFAALSIVAVTSCSEAVNKVNPADLDFQHPFGFGWDSFDGQGHQIGDGPAECRELIARLGGIIAPSESERFASLCATGKYTTIFVNNGQLQPWLRNGAISVDLRGASEPVAYEYHFLHRVFPNDGAVNKIRRHWQAFGIRRELQKVYGLTPKYGSFDQFSETGFVASHEKSGPCEAWLAENVGIILCTERVVLEDGIEMALSFIKLDRSPSGHSLRCMIDPVRTDSCAGAYKTPSSGSSSNYAGILETLAEWLGPETFSKCESAELETIEQVWTLPESEAAKLAAVLEAHSGDDLALYAINLEAESGMPAKMHEKIMMYLFKCAASQESALAMNEIGASLLYCYQHVKQDADLAKAWLEKAALANDPMAIKSLALMHLSRMTDSNDPLDEASRLLEKCSALDPNVCSNELRALKAFVALRNE